ncbi:MAG: hypothetical protein EBV73_07495, partial [Rhodocyclales bacterium]|nr:hypothetical protein [Rhodocyclales bacterium]
MNQPLPALLCLNAGSSSVKFSLYRAGGNDPEILLGGQIEGLLTQPHFKATDAQGNTLNERHWNQPQRRSEAVE